MKLGGGHHISQGTNLGHYHRLFERGVLAKWGRLSKEVQKVQVSEGSLKEERGKRKE